MRASHSRPRRTEAVTVLFCLNSGKLRVVRSENERFGLLGSLPPSKRSFFERSKNERI